MPTQKDEKKAKSSQKKSEEKNHLLQKQSLNQVKRILQKEHQVLELCNQIHWNWKTLLFFVCHRLVRTKIFCNSVKGKNMYMSIDRIDNIIVQMVFYNPIIFDWSKKQ